MLCFFALSAVKTVRLVQNPVNAFLYSMFALGPVLTSIVGASGRHARLDLPPALTFGREGDRAREESPGTSPIGPIIVLDGSSLLRAVDARGMPPGRVVGHAMGRVSHHETRD